MTDTERRWAAVRALLCSARASDRAMRDPRLATPLRDEATRAYCRDADALIEELGKLEDAHELPGRIVPAVPFRRSVA